MLPPKQMRNAYLTIKKEFGIDLTWSEKMALSTYIAEFKELRANGHPIGSYSEAITKFMVDYFDLDRYDLRTTVIRTYEHGRVCMKRIGADFIGNLDGKFQELCKSRVSQWREERQLV